MPTLSSSTPADNATDVAIGANIVLTFNEAVQAGSGNIILRPATGADITISVGSGQVTFNGSQVTINPTADLRPGIAYDVIIASGVITDVSSVAFAGIVQDELDFTTSSTIPAGTFSQTFTITDPGTFTLLAGTTRTQTTGTGVQATVTGGSATIDIQGTLDDTISGQRAIRANLAGGGQITVGANGLVQSLDGDSVQAQSANGTLNLTNLGQIISQTSNTTFSTSGPAPAPAAFALNYNAAVGAPGAPSTDFTSGGIITNGSIANSTALIQSNSGDAIRLGAHQTLVNYGVIDGNGAINDSSTNNVLNPDPNHQSVAQRYDVSRGVRINAATATNDTIENHGRIEGAQHAVDVGNVNATNIIVNNLVGATIVGHNGSGVGADTVGVAATTVTVENFGTILGEYGPQFDRAGYVTVDGDGDGVDVDGGATIINHAGATIAGTGAGGFDSSGRTNRSEGISIGGGFVTNDGAISGANFGIIVNNDSNPDNSRSGVLATTITNNATGTITGVAGFAIRLENKTGTAADNDTIVNFGTITGNGTIPDPAGIVVRQDTLADPGVSGTLDGVTYTSAANAGNARFISGDGSAIQTGEGDDTLSNHGTITGNSGRAINMEGGTDALNLFAGQTITGRIDGGAGTDTISLQGSGSGTLSSVINFETLSVLGGTWTITDTESYSGGTTVAAGSLLVNGSLGSSAVAVNGGTLGGSGTVGAVTVASGATLSPGASAGTLATGSLSFVAGAHFKVELGGTSAGQFDQVDVTGTVDLAGATLDGSLINGFNPNAAPGSTFTLIDNDLADAVSGIFAGLAEGASVVIGGSTFSISYQGGDGNDVVLTVVDPGLFTADNDTVTLPGPGTYFALGGDDIIFMTAAGETAYGGIGNDIYHVEAAGNTIVELVNEGTDTVQTGALAAYTLEANVENLTHTGGSNFVGIGNALGNVLIGGAGNDYLIGLDGNDVLVDGGGLNTLQGGAGDDLYAVQSISDTVFEFANEGTDQVQTFLSFYQLSPNVENLTFVGSATHTGVGNELNNVLIGGTGNDYLIGGAGNDILIDGSGLNTLQGGTGDDVYAVQSSSETVFEFANEGTDEVQTFLASYVLSANVEKLTFVGAFSHNGTGNELANTFAGSSASDTFTGAGGADVFNYRSSGNGFDFITDFNADNANAVEHDHIDLTGRGLNFAALSVTTVAGGITVGIPGGDAIFLKNVAANSLDAGDFFF